MLTDVPLRAGTRQGTSGEKDEGDLLAAQDFWDGGTRHPRSTLPPLSVPSDPQSPLGPKSRTSPIPRAEIHSGRDNHLASGLASVFWTFEAN